MRTFVALFLLSNSFLLVAATVSQADIERLLSRLREGPLDDSDTMALEGQPSDPRTLPVLRKAFEERQAKQEKQWIAATLLRLGDRSDKYFAFLAGYVKDAVEDRAPFFEKFDSQGRAIRGEFSAEFENWCKLNNKDTRTVAAAQVGAYLEDILLLAQVEDPRSIALFRVGLNSSNPGVIAYCLQGLGRLHDASVLPLLPTILAHIPAGERTIIATQLPWFSLPDADRLFEQEVPSHVTRDHARTDVERQRTIERSRVVRRSSGMPR